MDWKTLEDGGSGQWRYVHQINKDVFIFITMLDMVDACGNEAEYWLHGEIDIVDLSDMPEKQIESALKCCGIEEEEDKNNPLVIAICCLDYGAKAPMYQKCSEEIDKSDSDWKWEDCPDEDSDEFQEILTELKEYAGDYLADDDVRNELMEETVVNKIGQSAKEYMTGKSWLWDEKPLKKPSK